MSITKIPTNILGFDHIAKGGLPAHRTTLLVGTSGSAKTVFGAQFLSMGVMRAGEGAVFVTFEESAARLRANLSSLGWDIPAWESDGKWLFEDLSAAFVDQARITGHYDLEPILLRIEGAVKAIGARRVCLDSIGVLFARFGDSMAIRSVLFRIAERLNELSVTTLITAERVHEYGEISRHGVEEFVADNVIILRNALEEQRRRRTIEILKFRGTDHLKGEFPFTVVSGDGVVVLPLSAMELAQESSPERVTCGNAALDEMCGGGLFKDSIVLVSGATGTGKTLMSTEFLSASLDRRQRAVLFGFEESPAQLLRHAAGWGRDLKPHLESGRFLLTCQYPEVQSLEDHLLTIKRTIDTFRPERLVLDSLSSLERVGTVRAFREFVVGLTSFIKQQRITALITATSPELSGGTSVTESNIFTITDTILVLRYVEVTGRMRRAIALLKMRGSRHDTAIREFSISDTGMNIAEPYQDVSGILLGAGALKGR